jgi:hypothetical protein
VHLVGIYILENFSHLTSDSLEILIIQNQKFCFLPEKSFINITGRCVTCSKKLQRISVHQLWWYPWPIVTYSIKFVSYKDTRNTEEDPNAPQPAAEGDNQKEYSFDWLYNPSIDTVPTNYLQEHRSGHVPSDNKFDNLAPVQSHASWIHELKVCKSMHHHTIQIN